MGRYHVTTCDTISSMAPERAIGIVRVSQMRGREEASIPDQEKRIEEDAHRQGFELLQILRERDVSGGTPLAKREKLRQAVETIEAGGAEVLMVAYFDRLVRSTEVQAEILRRVEAAGGRTRAVDVGDVSAATAGSWLSAQMLGTVAEYHRRATRERVAGAQARAVAEGRPPWSQVPPGYRRKPDGGYEVDPETAPAVAEIFRMRGGGASLRECREHLTRRGIHRKFSSVQRMLGSRVYLGELHFGDLVNLNAWPAIVSREDFARAQKASAPRGRQSKSDMLLARLGVLLCGSCGSRMCAGSSNNGTTPIYRCRNADCDRKVTISANVVEPIVIQSVKTALRGVEGRASVESEAREAEADLARITERREAAIRTFADIDAEPVAAETIAALTRQQGEVQARVDRLGGSSAALTVTAAEDWSRLSLDGRRGLIRAMVERVAVAPGRGNDRISVELFGK